MRIFDVIIVGGGIAGLAAAHLFGKSGKSALLLEARDTLGGRLNSTDQHGQISELGAEYIHGSLGTKPYLENIKTTELSEFNVYSPGDNGLIQSKSIFQAWEEFYQSNNNKLPGDASLTTYLKSSSPKDSDLLQFYSKVFHAADPNKASLQKLFTDSDEDLDELHRTVGRYDDIVKNIFDSLPSCIETKLYCPVSSIQRENENILVEDQTGKSYFGQHAIVTTSIGALKRGHIDIKPIVPEFSNFLANSEMGGVVKINVILKKKLWKEDPLFIQNQNGNFQIWMCNDNRPVIIGWTGGPESFDLSKKPSPEIEKIAHEELAKTLGINQTDLQENLSGITFHNWNEDKNFAGAYTYPTVNNWQNLQAVLDKQNATGIAFAGEAYDTTGISGTIQGAYNSGRKTAEQLIQVLDKGLP